MKKFKDICNIFIISILILINITGCSNKEKESIQDTLVSEEKIEISEEINKIFKIIKVNDESLLILGSNNNDDLVYFKVNKDFEEWEKKEVNFIKSQIKDTTQIISADLNSNGKVVIHYLDENNKIVIAKNSDTEINLVLTSLNEIDSKYEIYYNILTDNVDNEDIEVGYTSTSFDSVVGTISSNGTKTVVLKLINNSDIDVQIEIGCEGGLVNNELVLTKGITTNHEINDGDIILAYNLDGPSELYPENFPKKDDGYKVTGVTCNGADAVWDNENWNVTISNMTGKTITCIVDLSVELVYDFAYKGYVEEFKVPYTGNYKLEVWGAQGGNYNDNG